MRPTPAVRLAAMPDCIHKHEAALAVPPHLRDWALARATFGWDTARRALGLQPDSSLNIAELALDRHAQGPIAQRVAVRWRGADGRSQRITYQALCESSHRVAHALQAAGLQRGDTLFVLAPRLPSQVAAVFGALRAGLVVAPLHPALGPEPLALRLQLGGCRTLLTTAALYRSSVAPVLGRLGALEQVLLIADGVAAEPASLPGGTVDLQPLLQAAPLHFTAPLTEPYAPALLHFTSGATGQPKGVLHAHQAALSLWQAGHDAFDLHVGDVHWCSADPGDFGGLTYGLIAPLLNGATVVLDEGGFDPARCCDLLQQQGVTVWTTTPAVVRQLMRADPALLRRHRFPRLRLLTSFGAALDAQAVWWGQEALGLPIHDQWSQTESGAIMIANTVAQDLKPGSMGRPLPGVDAFVVARRPGGRVEVLQTPEAEGELALRRGWPSMFRGYLGDEAAYRQCFAASAVGDLCLTGDLVRRDADGCYWFVGHAAQLIKSAGHSIAPREVEAALASHPAVAEAAVVGRPDATLGEAAVAFVTLAPGFAVSESLRAELLAHALQRLGPVAAPRGLEFASQLPHTRDGRLMRRLVALQARGPGT